MPRRKQRKIHAPLKQNIQLYREIQKDKSPIITNSDIQSASSIIEQESSSSFTTLTTLSEETLNELGIVSAHKKVKEKTKYLEPTTKKQRLNSEELNLNFATPEYLNISEQEFRNILNTPERIFTLVQDEALSSEEWQLDNELVNMTDEDFEKFIENSYNLEDTLNSTLDKKEKQEQKEKETIFAFLLETEKELENNSKENSIILEELSTSNENIDNYSEYDSDEDLDEEELLEKRRQKLRKKRTSQKKEIELLKNLEEDFDRLKEKAGTVEFDAYLYAQIEREIILKRKKIKNMQRICLNVKKYLQSKKGKENVKKYRESEYGKYVKKRYNESEKAKEAKKIYNKSEKGKETTRAYQQSERAKEIKRKYKQSEKGKEIQRECMKKYREKMKQKRLEEKLRAEKDPELKKILDEKNRIKNEKRRIAAKKKKLENLLLNNS